MKKSTIVIIILSILLAVASGIAIFNKISLNLCEKTSLKNILNDDNLEKTVEDLVEKGKKINDIVEDKFDDEDEEKIEEEWKDFVNNYKKNRPERISLMDNSCDFKIYANINNGEMTINVSDDGTYRKTIDNVLYAEFSETGNGGCNVLHFVKEDGTVGSYLLSDLTDNDIKYLDYKYIVKVVSEVACDEHTCAHKSRFIDIKGNIY